MRQAAVVAYAAALVAALAACGPDDAAAPGDGASTVSASPSEAASATGAPALPPGPLGPAEVHDIVAVGRDEVWAMSDSGWWRFADGVWTQAGPRGGGFFRGVLAADGSVWATTSAGLVRFTGDEWTLVSTAVGDGEPAAGPDGTVWAVEGRSVVGFAPDGGRTELPDPQLRAWSVWQLAAGPDGTLWVSSSGYAPAELARWNGGWQRVDTPPSWSQIGSSLVVAADGALWVFGFQVSELGRYAEGSWTTFTVAAGDLAAAPGGLVCVAAGAVTCYDAHGTGMTQRVPGAEVRSISIAPDGSTWVFVPGEHMLRLRATGEL